MKPTSSILCWVIILSLARIHAAEFFVSPAGRDSDPGTREQPFATVQRAERGLRTLAGKEPVTITLRNGTYYLPETLVLSPANSGTSNAPVVFRAAEGESPSLSGGLKLQLHWEPFRDQILQARIPTGLVADQLFINGVRQPLARYPNFDAAASHFNGSAADAISPERVARWADPRGGFIHAMHEALWGGMHYVITGKDPAGHLLYQGGWQNNRPAPMHKEYRFVENIFEELDAPGEWFLNTNSATLFFYPPPGVDMDKATVEVAQLRHILEFRGSAEAPVRFVSFHGISFRHSLRTFMETREPILRSDWTIYRGGAVLINGAEDCAIEDAVIDQVGGNALFVNNYNRRLHFRGLHIVGAGANGIAFVGNPAAVRTPSSFADHRTFAEIDQEPGPRSTDYPADCLVEDCLIHETGRVEKQTAPIEIDMAQSITVRHCSLYDVPRAGINIGDGCWGGHLVEFCDIFDTVRETGDHGSFNSWGRDRFWNLGGIDLDAVTLGTNRNLPLLDMVKPNVLRQNRWRCDHGWDIDLDDGSSNFEIRNNLCLNGGIKLREGFYRLCENNIMVNNSFHPHVWFGHSQDIFRHNIVFQPYKPIRVVKPWGQECDYNLLHVAGAAAATQATVLADQSGLDAHSLQADAQFLDPQRGDYRVREGSPALQLGFVNFAMDQFGVQKPALKAMARTPELPAAAGLKLESHASGRDARVVAWRGTKVKNVTTLDEVSAAGLPGEIGVRIVDAPPGTALARAGLRDGDVIIQCNGEKVNTTDDLAKFARISGNGAVTIGIYRDSRIVPIVVP